MSNTNSNPCGWTTVRLGDVGQWYGGGTPSKFESRFWTGGKIPWVSPKDMKSLRIIDSEDHLSQSAIDETNIREFPRGTVLLVIRSGILSRTLPVGVAQVPGTMNQDLKGVRPAKGIEPMFLAYQLIGREREALNKCSKHGTTVASIDTERLHDFEIRVAPTSEQRRIVAKIEELFSDLDAGVAALERVRVNLKRYRAAVLKAAVEGRLTEEWRTRHPATEPAAKLLERILAERRVKWEQGQLRKFEDAGKTPPKGWRENFEDSSAPLIDGLGSLPPGWSWSNIDRIADVQGGIQKQPKRAPVKNAYPYLRVANVRRDQLLLDDMEKFELFPGELERLRLELNDLLIVEGNGSLTEIGRSAIWRGEIPNCVHQNHIIRVRPLGVLTGFVNMYWNSPNGAKRVMAEAASTSGLYTLSVTKVCRLPVPLPPLAEQAEIVAEVDRRLSVADAAETQVEHALQRAVRLRQAILKRAFEGKLVPQDPADEPATTMKQKIPHKGPITIDLRPIRGRKHHNPAT